MSKRPIPYPSPWFSWIIVALAILSIYLVTRIHVDNNFEGMLEQSSEEARVYDDFVRTFGNDEFVVIALSGKDLFADDALDAMLATTKLLEKSPYVAQVDGIPAVFRDRFGSEDPQALKQELTSTPFYKNLFISNDARVGGIMVQLKPSKEPQDEQTLHDIREAIKPLRDYGFTIHLVGGPVMSMAISELSEQEGVRTFSVAALTSLIVLILLVRSFRGSLTVILCGAISMLLTYGYMGLVGGELNVVTSSLPPIMWVLMLANAIHVVCRYQHYRSRYDTAREAAHKTLDEVWLPCVLASITTMVGFSSLIVAELKPVRDFGIYSAIGMFISTFVNLIFAPHLLVFMHARAQRWPRLSDGRIFERLANFDMRYPWPIVGVFVVLTALGTYSATRLRTEPNPLSLLPDNSETVESYRFVAKNLTGFYAMELVVDTPGGWLNPEYWKTVSGVIDRLDKSDVVARTISPLDFLKKVNQWDHKIDPAFYKLPDTRKQAEELMNLAASGDDKGGLQRLASKDGGRMRVTVIIKTSDSTKLVALVKQAEDEMAHLPAPMKGVVTGLVPRMQSMQFRLINTQMTSFGLSFLMVFACILIGLRSWVMTGMSVLPNFMPILSVFTVMVVRGIPLDAATVMVASISMGTAVDNCVHMLATYRQELAGGRDNRDAIRTALGHVGASITTTTLVGTLGFFALLMSRFKPIFYFGELSGIAMLTALSAPTLFLPAILSLRRLHMERYAGQAEAGAGAPPKS